MPKTRPLNIVSSPQAGVNMGPSPRLEGWKSKSVLLALALHLFLFLGLFQLGFTTEEWNRIKTIAKEYSVGPLAKTILQEHGPFGFVTW